MIDREDPMTSGREQDFAPLFQAFGAAVFAAQNLEGGLDRSSLDRPAHFALVASGTSSVNHSGPARDPMQ